MNKNPNQMLIKTAALVGALVIALLALYRFGEDLPLVNELPVFSEPHENSLRPEFADQGEIAYWTCNMHPSVRLKDEGPCPICGMDTVSVKAVSFDDSGGSHMGHDHSSMGGIKKTGDVDGSSVFNVSPDRQQLIGVKTSEVTQRILEKDIRTVGTVVLDETKIYNVHTRVEGWIKNVYADFTWQHVHKGDPLFSIYSPELVSAQEEYLLALRSNEILGGSDFSDISSGSRSLLNASRKRLKLWGVTDSQIRELERSGQAKETLIIYSPQSGHVAQKNVFQNMYVEPNTVLYKIADHTSAWVEVDIYENEISEVKLGQSAVITLPSYPGEQFEGEVAFIWPHLDHQTRTLKVRLEFENPDLKLLPEMYADVELSTAIGNRLTVPVSAVTRTGKNDIVFIDKGKGNMEIRLVQLGKKAGGYYEVLRGLSNGERVVTQANFLIDSESQVQAAVATWGDGLDETQ